jgi:thiamine-phosphate diphosphorylase
MSRALVDRVHGLYGIADSAASHDDPVRLAAHLLTAGCSVVQLRCKGWSNAETLRAAVEVRALCVHHHALFIVNDHPQVAVEADAHGVHLGQTDADTEEVRSMVGPNRLIGRSTNALAQISATSARADYLAFGPIFSTPHLSRPKNVVGIAQLRAARHLTSLPLVAIGGITARNLRQVIEAGADAWAVIGAIALADDPVRAARALRTPPSRPSR